MKATLLAKLKALREEALQALPALQSLKELDDYRIQILGRKGALTELLRGLGGLAPDERPAVGQEANRLKSEIESRLQEVRRSLEAKAPEGKKTGAFDVTLPGLDLPRGHRHPIRQVQKEIEEIFFGLGFSIYEGPDVESDYYNFEALNFPADHPAREMQDTFYIKSEIRSSKSETNSKSQIPNFKQLLLRTHTSPVQIRAMERKKPPLYMICPGAVYRHDDDVTHSPMFHQVEGLMVDEHITLGDLKGVLTLFCREMFGKKREVRFRLSYFPFVEPGVEIDISCALCDKHGCRVCGSDGWLEILGAGMVHPAVLENVGVDPRRFSGFAFGMGVERIAMLKYGIDDIRLFYQSDLRFLEQF